MVSDRQLWLSYNGSGKWKPGGVVRKESDVLRMGMRGVTKGDGESSYKCQTEAKNLELCVSQDYWK